MEVWNRRYAGWRWYRLIVACCRKTKLTNVVYTWEYSGFWMKMTAALSPHRGGVAVFYRKAGHFAIEELRRHVLNILSFQLETGRQR